ncbi:hypothetical protein Droror1_Dr00007956, partial [Drosera rotundifolia]
RECTSPLFHSSSAHQTTTGLIFTNSNPNSSSVELWFVRDFPFCGCVIRQVVRSSIPWVQFAKQSFAAICVRLRSVGSRLRFEVRDSNRVDLVVRGWFRWCLFELCRVDCGARRLKSIAVARGMERVRARRLGAPGSS